MDDVSARLAVSVCPDVSIVYGAGRQGEEREGMGNEGDRMMDGQIGYYEGQDKRSCGVPWGWQWQDGPVSLRGYSR